MICPECGIDRNDPAGDQTEVCYCRTDRRRNPVITAIVARETLRNQIGEVLGVNPNRPLGWRITERIMCNQP